MNNFEADLTATISFTDLMGKPVTIPAGKRVTVSRVAGPLTSFNLDGQRQVEQLESYFGTIGNDSFDLAPNEFAVMN